MTRRVVLLTAWPLFAGLAFIMAGSGLQNTLLGVRANVEHFDVLVLGAITSLYYTGFLAGSLAIPKLIASVGHIRVFTALTALASTTVLAHGVFVTPAAWMLARIVTGFSFAGLYVVIESWLNGLANKKTRGSVLGIYLVINYSALALGQLLLNVAPPEKIEPFILVSVLVSLAAVPVALTKKPAPAYEEPDKLGVRELWQVSPLSFYSLMASGFCAGVLLLVSPFYAATIGMSTAQVASFMAFFVIGGICGQMPVGILSDRIGRRKTIIGVAATAAILSLLCFLASGTPWLLNLFFFLLGSTSLTVYALGSGLAIDHLHPKQYVSAAGTMLIVNGSGAIMGPTLISALLVISPELFFPALACAYLTLVLFGLYRSTRREALSMEAQENFIPGASATNSSQIATQMAVEVAEEESSAIHRKSGT